MSEVIDADQVETWFAQMDATFNALTFREPLGQAAVPLAVGVAEHIITSTAPSGAAYPPLKRKRPKGHNPDARPLIDTTRLLQSLSGGADHIEDVEDMFVSMGTSVPYAGYHEFGTKHIPARPFIGISGDAQERTTDLIGDFIVDALAGS